MKKKYYPSTAHGTIVTYEDNLWWFTSREKIIFWVIQSKLDLNGSILEIGSGTGRFLDKLTTKYPEKTITGIEWTSEGYTLTKVNYPNLNVIQGDLFDLQKNHQTENILAFDVLEHIEDDECAIDKIFSLLPIGGYFVLTVPQHMWLWSKIDDEAFHKRRYESDELTSKLLRSGFKVVYLTSFVSLLLPFMWISRKFSSNTSREGEYKWSQCLNTIFNFIMLVERFLIKLNVKFKFGGSMLIVAKK